MNINPNQSIMNGRQLFYNLSLTQDGIGKIYDAINTSGWNSQGGELSLKLNALVLAIFSSQDDQVNAFNYLINKVNKPRDGGVDETIGRISGAFTKMMMGCFKPNEERYVSAAPLSLLATAFASPSLGDVFTPGSRLMLDEVVTSDDDVVVESIVEDDSDDDDIEDPILDIPVREERDVPVGFRAAPTTDDIGDLERLDTESEEEVVDSHTSRSFFQRLFSPVQHFFQNLWNWLRNLFA